MKETIEEILSKPYSRNFIINNDGTYSVEILEFSGCYSQGDTLEEAMDNLNNAARSWVEASLDLGQDIPEPNMNKGYSGRIVLRMPKGIHRRAASMAEREGVSLNHYLVTSIATRVGAEDFFNRLANRFEQRMVSTAVEIRGMLTIENVSFSPSKIYELDAPFTLIEGIEAGTEANHG